MALLKSSVPKFGNWDKRKDISYSFVFDSARGQREKSVHLLEGDASDVLSGQSFYKNSRIGDGKGTPDGIYSGMAREDRWSFLPTARQDEIYTHMKLHNPEAVAGRGLSYVPQGLNSRVLGYNQSKSPSGVQVLPDPSVALAYNSRLPSSAPSGHLLQSGTTNKTASLKARPHVIQDDVHHEERLHAKSTNTPSMNRKVMYEENLAIANTRSSQRGLEVSRAAANMRRKHAVPKFGDWDYGDKFTAEFTKMRLEKRSEFPLDSTVKPVSPLQQFEEDLYTASITSDSPIKPKKQSRWMPLVCCMGSSSHIVER